MSSPSDNPKQLTRFEKFAQKVEPGLAASQAFLANSQMAHLRQLLTRPVGIVQTGATVLFAGIDGNSKITAAAALASELRLSLFRIDLAAVVSKYIGETEKNLDTIFNSAEASSAILFFDEADALFGKRSEVKDSHDRFANVEISVLLQRIEQSHVIAILATNAIPTWPPDWLRHVQSTLHFPPLP
jgi:SpoVK/Ycf46/Vps4 family AAA+-type ATPase